MILRAALSRFGTRLAPTQAAPRSCGSTTSTWRATGLAESRRTHQSLQRLTLPGPSLDPCCRVIRLRRCRHCPREVTHSGTPARRTSQAHGCRWASFRTRPSGGPKGKSRGPLSPVGLRGCWCCLRGDVEGGAGLPIGGDYSTGPNASLAAALPPDAGSLSSTKNTSVSVSPMLWPAWDCAASHIALPAGSSTSTLRSPWMSSLRKLLAVIMTESGWSWGKVRVPGTS